MGRPPDIDRRILDLRGVKVMLDLDLAGIYGVQTKVLNQAVRRNSDRFPADFMFRLTAAEKKEVVTNCDHLSRLRFSPTLPFAFTEHGALMVAAVLNTPTAVQTSLYVVRAFVKIRALLVSHRELAHRLDRLEARIEKGLTGHDEAIAAMLSAIRELMNPPLPKRRGIGFLANPD